ncbi:MAG: FkbM family methyltransferase [Burkholderiaceae bacterium]
MKFLVQVLDYFASRYLAYRGALHLRLGYPSIAAFAFDHIGHEINIKGRYEAADLAATFKFLGKRALVAGIAVDVGANIGNHSLYFSEHFEQVVSLEPNPRVFELLCFNVKLRGNIQPFNIGASDTGGEMALSFSPGNWGGGQLVGGSQDQSNTFSVTVKRLDELDALASRSVGLIKIDVEGHELPVLKGAIKLLLRSRPGILFEQQPADIAQGSSAVVDWLKSNGYDQFYEVQSFPGLPKGWTFPGRKVINGLMRVVAGERKSVVPIGRFEKAFYPMIIALQAS